MKMEKEEEEEEERMVNSVLLGREKMNIKSWYKQRRQGTEIEKEKAERIGF